MFCACSNTEDIQKEPIVLNQSNIIEEQKSDFYYEELNKDSLNINSINLFNHITKEEIYEYSEQVKGAYTEVLNSNDIFSKDFIKLMEEALFNSCNYSSRNLMQEILRNVYFNTIESLGADNYKPNLEELYQLFPDLNEHKDEISNIYEAFQLIDYIQDCNGIFYTGDEVSSEDYYVFTYASGGSNGVNYVLIAKKKDDDFVKVCEFQTQNYGYASVTRFGDSFYYIFLEYNYNLKNYDGIRIHKLGANAETQNILIKYIPEKYIWKKIYDSKIYSSSDINDYIESIKNVISSSQYLDSGQHESAQFYGDEAEADYFPLANEFNQYYKIDFANTDTPVYIRKSNFVPSNYRSTWHLRAKFYIYEPQSDTVLELERLELGKELPFENELVQMWFKEIDSKVFTFTVHHISDYNYMFNVLLIEDGKIEVVRTDIISPQREFVLKEGEIFRAY